MEKILNKIPIKSIVLAVLHRHLLILLIITPMVLGFSLLRVLGPIGQSNSGADGSEQIIGPASFNPDQSILTKIRDLSEQEVDVEANFSEDRINPFEN